MGTSIRSIFARAPLAIPPPVVCWVIPIGIIDDVIVITTQDVSQEIRWNPEGYVLTKLTIQIKWRTPPAWTPALIRGKFWLQGLVPAQPVNPENNEPLPMPYPSEQEVPMDPNGSLSIAFGTIRYDDTVSLRVKNAQTIFGHKYIDLKKAMKEGSG